MRRSASPSSVPPFSRIAPPPCSDLPQRRKAPGRRTCFGPVLQVDLILTNGAMLASCLLPKESPAPLSLQTAADRFSGLMDMDALLITGLLPTGTVCSCLPASQGVSLT